MRITDLPSCFGSRSIAAATACVVALGASGAACPASAGVGAVAHLERVQAQPDTNQGPNGLTGPDASTETDGVEKAPPGTAEKPKGPTDPLSQIMKTGNLKTKLGRSELRDNLYALLATTEDAKLAKRIERRIRQVWLVTGSDTVLLLVQRANKAIKEKKRELGTKFLDAALDLAPDFADGWTKRAINQYYLGNVREAVGDLRRAIALDPNNFQALRVLGDVLSESGEEAAALTAYERLLDIYPLMEGAQKAHDRLRDKVKGRGI